MIEAALEWLAWLVLHLLWIIPATLLVLLLSAYLIGALLHILAFPFVWPIWLFGWLCCRYLEGSQEDDKKTETETRGP